MVELLTSGSNEINSVTTFIPNCDPITMILLFPFMPAIAIMRFHMNMMQQLSQSQPIQQQKTKITSITRNGNTLDIIEKWI